MVDRERRNAIKKIGSIPLLAAGIGGAGYATRGVWYPFDDTLSIPDLEEAVREQVAARPPGTYHPLDADVIDVGVSFGATDWPEKEYTISLAARPLPDAGVPLCTGDGDATGDLGDGFEAVFEAAYDATGQYVPANRMPYEEAVTAYRLSARGDDGMARITIDGDAAGRIAGHDPAGIEDSGDTRFEDVYEREAEFVCF